MSKLALCVGFQINFFTLVFCQEESNRISKCFILTLFNLKKGRLMTIFQNIQIFYKEDYILLFPKDRIGGQILENFLKA